MALENNFATYTQEGAEKLIATYLQYPNKSLKYVTSFGSGESWEMTDIDSFEIKRIKEVLLEKYSDLWKELSNR